MIKKKSYECRVYESVDDNSLSKAISQKTDEKKINHATKGQSPSLSSSDVRPLPWLPYRRLDGSTDGPQGGVLPAFAQYPGLHRSWNLQTQR